MNSIQISARTMPGLIGPLLCMLSALPLLALASLFMVGAFVAEERHQPDGQILLEIDQWATWKLNWLPNLMIYSAGLLLLLGLGCFIRALSMRLSRSHPASAVQTGI
jgi:hypothetical protein